MIPRSKIPYIEASHPKQAIEQYTVRNKVFHLMALLETKDAMALFVVATTIMALVMSPCFGQGEGDTLCLGTLITFFLWFHMSTWFDFGHCSFYFAVDCGILPECTVENCQDSCVTRGYTNFTTVCTPKSCCCLHNCKRPGSCMLFEGGWAWNFLCMI